MIKTNRNQRDACWAVEFDKIKKDMGHRHAFFFLETPKATDSYKEIWMANDNVIFKHAKMIQYLLEC